MSQKTIENNLHKEQKIKPGLYLVGTPIGNLGDISLRALDVLKQADFVACEDSRVSGKLMAHYGLKKNLIRYHDHSDEDQRRFILGKIQAGLSVVLICDAGMPLIADPGYKLVRECIKLKLHVSAVPGANAALMALQLSGLPSDQFVFLGFLPSKTKARQEMLRQWSSVPAALIAYETAPRLPEALKDIQSILGERDICVCRELTKLYEECARGKTAELIEFYKQKQTIKGEIVIVIGQGEKPDLRMKDLEAMIRDALKTMSTKKAAEDVARQTGASKKELYQIALRLKS